ncbi:DUF397 domain-containing protein [Streptomyces sp. or43]|nr:DUF397 domain-containing protein [Streptomyces sp. or43]
MYGVAGSVQFCAAFSADCRCIRCPRLCAIRSRSPSDSVARVSANRTARSPTARSAGTALVPVRDSKAPTGPALVFGPDAWSAFVEYAARR